MNKGAIFAVESHTEGEPTRIVLSGIPLLKGRTMADKMHDLLTNHDNFRKLLMNEPRGHNDMFGALLVPPCNPEADYGVLYTESGGCLNMCGHGTIGTATVLVENGLVPMVEPQTMIKLDTPAGLVIAKANVKDHKVQSVSFENVPSFLYKRDLELDIPEVGKIKFDIAFGGSFFAILDIAQLNLTIEIKNTNQLVKLGMKIMEFINENVKVQHPEKPQINRVDLVEFFEKPNSRHPKNYSNCVIFGLAQWDRSPCGTGTSAKLATLYAKGELKVGEEFVYQSILGTKFTGKILSTTKVGEFEAVIPEITGRAWITGYSNWTMQPDDPFQAGFNHHFMK